MKNAKKGAYIISEDFDYDLILIASGSEVEIALKAKEVLNNKGLKLRVVSMLCTEVYEEQSKDYKNKILPPQITYRLAIEAGASQSWHKYVGTEGKIIGIDKKWNAFIMSLIQHLQSVRI